VERERRVEGVWRVPIYRARRECERGSEESDEIGIGNENENGRRSDELDAS